MTGRYRIQEKLGEFLPPDLLDSGDARRPFAEEARAISAPNHPHIETLYDICEDAGAPVEYAHQIATGLGYAHRRGLVHGDVKPDNFLFAEDGRLKVTDFGLARFDHGRTVTLDGRIEGTPAYLAPECLRGLPASRRTDMYAAGLILSEMAPDPPEALDGVVRRATAQQSEQRYRSMDELAEDLRRLSHEAPVPGGARRILVIEDDFSHENPEAGQEIGRFQIASGLSRG